MTTNVNIQCCRNSDSGGNGAVGDWYFPHGTKIPRGANIGNFFRTGSVQQVRLSRMSHVMAPVGAYECRVPDSSGVVQVPWASLKYTIKYVLCSYMRHLQ